MQDVCPGLSLECEGRSDRVERLDMVWEGPEGQEQAQWALVGA